MDYEITAEQFNDLEKLERGYYVAHESDDGEVYRLDTKKAMSSIVTMNATLKARKQERNDAKAAKGEAEERAKQLQEKLSAFGDADPELVRSLLEKSGDDPVATKTKDVSAIRKAAAKDIENKLQPEIERLNADNQKLRDRISSQFFRSEIRRAATDAGFDSEFIELAEAKAERDFKVQFEGEDMEIVLKDETLAEDDVSLQTLDGFFAAMVEKHPRMRGESSGVGARGAGAKPPKKVDSLKEMTVTEKMRLKASDPARYAQLERKARSA